jgi:amidohydrolase
MDLLDTWRAAMATELPAAIELRHVLHASPRVGGEEHDTTLRLTEAIGRGKGRRIARTGAILRLGPPHSPAPAVAVRTELDALPIAERTVVPWASTNGAMHACAHDVHMAAVVAVARAAQRVDLPVPLIVLLQPREEGADSGARDVVTEDGLADVGAVIAAHCQPQLAAGVVAATPGPVNAGTEEFTISVTGRGGHPGYPHTVDDSVLALSAIVVALQQVAARRIDPTVGVACMVNQLRAGSANNVVPSSATGSGTLRTMRRDDRLRAAQAISDVTEHVAAAYGCRASVSFAGGEPPLVNDPPLASATSALLRRLGHRVAADFRSFGSDDFSLYCARVRGLMMFVGTGADTGGLHDASYLPGDEYVGLVADALIAGYCGAVTVGAASTPG